MQNSFILHISMRFIMSNASDLFLTPAGRSSLYVPTHGSGEIEAQSLGARRTSIHRPCEEPDCSDENLEAIASGHRTRRLTHSFHGDAVEDRNQAVSARGDFESLLVDRNANQVRSPPRTIKHMFRPCPRRPGSDESSTSASHHHQLTYLQPSDQRPFDSALGNGGFDARHDPFLCVEESESWFLDAAPGKRGYLPSYIPDLESVEMTGSPVRLSIKPVHHILDICSDVTCSTIQWIDDSTQSFAGMPVAPFSSMLPWSRPTSYPSTPEAMHS